MRIKADIFEITILRQHWIKDDGKDDPHDKCSHGRVFVQIGAEILHTESCASLSLSTAGLFLLRSLQKNCDFEEFDNLMMPHCGHSIYLNEEDPTSVLVLGCPGGVDWRTTHRDKMVELETRNGTKALIPFERFKDIVLRFVCKIEGFYGAPENKVPDEDEYFRLAFERFWLEWRALKNVWM
ncbi:MAG: hypothetical protein AAF590_10325 [Pseudomonadota bacterium]